MCQIFSINELKDLEKKSDYQNFYQQLILKKDYSQQSFIYHIIKYSILGQLQIDNVVQFFNEMKNLFQCDIVVECLCLILQEQEITDQIKKNLNNFYNGLQVHLNQSVMEILEENQLSDLSLINLEQFKKRKNKITTKLYYVQQNFNLFREENEGYSKIIVQLLDGSKFIKENIDTIKTNILSLIGQFDLDPDRVLELILSAYEINYQNRVFIDLIKLFNINSIPHILGFKFSQYLKNQRNLKNITLAVPINQVQSCINLYSLINTTQIIATLIIEGLISIESIWVHLSPSDQEMENLQVKRIQIAEKQFKSKYSAKLRQDPEEKKKDKEKEAEEQKRFKDQMIYNQKYWLLQALVKNNAWVQFEQIFHQISSFIDLSTHKPLQQILFSYLSWLIDPIYSQISPAKLFGYKKNVQFQESQYGLNQQSDFSQLEFWKNLYRVFQVIESYIGEDAIIFCKICRVCQKFYEQLEFLEVKDLRQIQQIIQIIFGKYMLPGLTLFNSNPGTVEEFWKVFQNFDYIQRYQYYDNMVQNGIYKTPLLILKNSITIKLVKKWKKQISKEKIRQNSRFKIFINRELGKFSLNNPLIVLNEMIQNIKGYPNQISSMVQSMSYCSDLTFDVTVFVILRHCSDANRNKLNEYDANVEEWLQNLSMFTGSFLKKNYNIDFSGIFAYTCNKLQNDQTSQLQIMKELLIKMTGADQIQALNESQLQALAGGPCLQIESISLTQEFRSAKRSQQALEKFLWSKQADQSTSLVYKLLILLCQQRSKILSKTQTDKVKLLGILQDRINDTLTHLVKFLRFNTTDYQKYLQIIPPNSYQDLIYKYKLSQEIACFITRSGFKPFYQMTNEEFQNTINTFAKVFNDFDYETHQIVREYQEGLTPQFIYKDFRKQMWQFLSPELYTMFWILSLENIYVPIDSYNQEIEKLKNEIQKCEDGKLQDTNNTRNQRSKIEKEISGYKKSIETLHEEMSQMKAKNVEYMNFIQKNKDKFIEIGERIQSLNHFIQFCLLPRILVDPQEALFCAKFIDLIFGLKKFEFQKNYINCITQIMHLVIPIFQCCTEKEAINASIFFHELLQPLSNWNDDQKMKALLRKIQGTSEKYEERKVQIQLVILMIFDKIHEYIKTFNSEGYQQIRNSLILLDKIKAFDPCNKSQAEFLEKYITKIQQNIKQYDDLTLMVNNYSNNLNQKKPSLSTIEVTQLNKKWNELKKGKDESQERKKEEKQVHKKEATEQREERKKKDDRSQSNHKKEQKKETPDNVKNDDPESQIQKQKQLIKEKQLRKQQDESNVERDRQKDQKEVEYQKRDSSSRTDNKKNNKRTYESPQRDKLNKKIKFDRVINYKR